MADPPASAPAPTSTPPTTVQHEEREQNILKSLETLWYKYSGDMERIFESLREPMPPAWRDEPPQDAPAFARRYYYGRDGGGGDGGVGKGPDKAR